jgi:hypothetical protein
MAYKRRSRPGIVERIPHIPASRPNARRWCDQCDRRVADLEAETCRARFCLARSVGDDP